MTPASERTGEKAGVAVVGAGRMGQGIALAFAHCGQPVSLVDLKPRPPEEFARLAAAARDNVRRDLDFLHSVNALGGGGIDDFLHRIHIVDSRLAATAIAHAQVIFEAVPETLEAKRAGLDSICACASPDAFIASTTSTFDANMLAGLVVRPERFANAHWLNPAHLMPLVEVSPARSTDPAQVARLLDLLKAIGKVPIVCASSPGYIVPRIQALAMNEAARLVEEGVASAADIDTAVRVGFGLRFAVLGLLEFIDWGGGDILYHASRNLAENLDSARFAAPPIVERNMHEGRRGLRDGAGFFEYHGQDVESYRNARLAAFVALLRHRDLMPAAQATQRTIVAPLSDTEAS